MGGNNSELSELARSAGDPCIELLTTRLIVCQVVRVLGESKLPPMMLNKHDIIGRLDDMLSSLRINDSGSNGSREHNSSNLSSGPDRNKIYSLLVEAVSELHPKSVVCATAVSLLTRLLRCWGVSRTGGSLQKALEAIPQSLSVEGSRSLPSYPAWMDNQFHVVAWKNIINLLERFGLYIDIAEVLIVDVDMHLISSTILIDVDGNVQWKFDEKLSSLANEPKVPEEMKCTVRSNLSKVCSHEMSRN